MIRKPVISVIISVDYTGRSISYWFRRLRRYASAPPRPAAPATQTINPLHCEVVV